MSIEEQYDEVRQLITSGKEKGYLLSIPPLKAPRSRSSTSHRGRSTRPNDPVRRYLREMGTVPLLTREGEVTIARRIERGKHAVMTSISRAPLIARKVIALGDQLHRGDIRQIEAKALHKLRHASRSQKLRAFLEG